MTTNMIDSMKILYVEDHPAFAATVIRRFLGEHEVRVVPGVGAAARALDEAVYDLVLLDYDLEDGKGTEVLAALQERPWRPPVIAVSSHAAGNTALQAAGADAVCGKMEFARIQEVIAAVRGG